MDIFNQIYNSQYFVLGLFIMIVILAIVFLVLVFSGKKNKKKDNVETNNNLDTIQNVNLMDQVPDTQQPLNNTQPNLVEQINNVAINPEGVSPMINATNLDASNNSAPISPVVEPIMETSNQVEDLGKMNFTFEPIDNVVNNEPVLENTVPSMENIENNNVEEPAVETNNLFNTSIFHDIPAELASTPVEMPGFENTDNIMNNNVEEIKPEVNETSNLFEPIPDLNNINIPVEEVNLENNIDALINEPVIEQPLVQPAPITEEVPSFKAEPISYDKSNMPNQFSSVYINKEEPKQEEPKISEPVNNIPPYDPVLFERKFEKPVIEEVKPVEPISTPVMEPPIVDTNINIPNDFMATSNPFEVNNNINDTFNDFPKIDTVPALEPMENMESNSVVEEPIINPKNTFEFELPSLAKQPEMPKEESVTPLNFNEDNANNTTSNSENSFPNFINETYDVK